MALRKQLSITVVNQAGEGAKLCGLLKDAGINIEAISVCEFTEGGVVRIVVDDEREAVKLLRGKGYGVLVRVVLAVTLDDKPGALGEALSRLARARINVNYCYGSRPPGGGETEIVFAVDDAVRADILFAERD
jgi:hypothetical protein